MSEKPIIEVKNVSKTYKIRHETGSYVTLRDVLANTFKHPLRFLKKKAKEVAGLDKEETFWALRDINFNVAKGEIIGIIGANGAGKSTLLKLLSQITPPSHGEIIIRGNMASLLEVGTGFHPELTGRENIFLNGAILGMSKKEISEKFAQIIEFSGVEQFLDTPVKHYSSGMYVRLAFSVAVHMEPDILIIDEVLAVGDSEFQKKCLQKMEEITQKEDRTILFVSHNLVSVQNLCKKTILIEKGRIKKIGPTKEVTESYVRERSKPHYVSAQNVNLAHNNKNTVHFTGITVSNLEGSGVMRSDDKLKIVLKYASDFSAPISDVRVVVTIDSRSSKQTVLRLDSDVTEKTIDKNLAPVGEIVCQTDTVHLIEDAYLVHVDFLIQGTSQDYVKGAAEFTVENNLEKYGYVTDPDKTISSRMIKYSFKQHD